MIILKNYRPKGRRYTEDRLRDFWGYETGMGQKVAQFHNRYNDDDDDDADDLIVK